MDSYAYFVDENGQKIDQEDLTFEEKRLLFLEEEVKKVCKGAGEEAHRMHLEGDIEDFGENLDGG